MRRMRAFVLVLGVTALSGCASFQVSQDLNRIQSHVKLLDERVTQLEHLSTREPSTASVIEGDLFEADSGVAPAFEGDFGTSIRAEVPPSKPTTREIQQALHNAGFFQAKIDGKMGPVTREAIRAFQRMNDLKVDGLVGKRTWATLSVYTDSSLASGELGAAEILK